LRHVPHCQPSDDQNLDAAGHVAKLLANDGFVSKRTPAPDFRNGGGQLVDMTIIAVTRHRKVMPRTRIWRAAGKQEYL